MKLRHARSFKAFIVLLELRLKLIWKIIRFIVFMMYRAFFRWAFADFPNHYWFYFDANLNCKNIEEAIKESKKNKVKK